MISDDTNDRSNALASHLRKHCSGDVVALVTVLGRRDALTTAPDLPADVPLDANRIIPVHLTDRSALIGPVAPDSAASSTAACWHCVAVRWQQLRPRRWRDALERGGDMLGHQDPTPLTRFACDQIQAVFEHVARSRADDVCELRLDTFALRRYPIMADPSCPNCGTKTDTAERGGALRSRYKHKPDDDRIIPVRRYGLTVSAFVNPQTGLLSEAVTPRYDSPTTSVVSGNVGIRDGSQLVEFAWSGHADTYEDSTLLGVCEGLERHAGLRRPANREVIVASRGELAEPSVNPTECGFRTYRPELRIPWVPGYSVRDERPVLVPEQLAYYYISTASHQPGVLAETSSGCALGGCWEEAVLHALLEIVERDAFLLCWYGGAHPSEIDPTSVPTAETRWLCERLWRHGYAVRLFDTRVDLPIPVVTSVAVRRPGFGDGWGAVRVSAGASLDPTRAASAAVREVASGVLDLPERARRRRDDLERMVADYSHVVGIHDHGDLFGHPDMVDRVPFLHGGQTRSFADSFARWNAVRPRNLDLTDDLRYCRDLLVDAGFDVVTVDQTSPEQRTVGLSTARVLVPGMLPLDFGWRRQRATQMPRLTRVIRDLDLPGPHLVPHPFM